MRGVLVHVMDGMSEGPLSLKDILLQVVFALVEQGHEVPEITQAMRYVADITDVTDRVYGDKM
jgi:hypothetical protein